MVPSRIQKRGLCLLIGKRWHKRGGRCCAVGGGGAFLDGRALGLLLLLRFLLSAGSFSRARSGLSPVPRLTFCWRMLRCCRWKRLVQESHRKGEEQMSSPASTSEAHKKILLIAEPIVTTATTQVFTETCLGSWQMLKHRTRSTRSLTLRNPCYRDFGMIKPVHPLSID